MNLKIEDLEKKEDGIKMKKRNMTNTDCMVSERSGALVYVNDTETDLDGISVESRNLI